MNRSMLSTIIMLSLAFTFARATAHAQKIVLIAGIPSHGKGDHEFNAGTKILTDCLNKIKGVQAVMVKGGWPTDESVFDGAASVVFYMDGGDNHPMFASPTRFNIMSKLTGKGVGLVCLHYAVEFPKGRVGDTILNWLGGYYETGYSTNPHNDVIMTVKPNHEITRGVHNFQALDEWYYRIRFSPNDKRVMPILTTLLPKDKPILETCAWATVRENGGRSFGFTGGHTHTNWGKEDFRKLILNAIVWSAKINVPKDGIKSEVTAEQLAANLDPKP